MGEPARGRRGSGHQGSEVVKSSPMTPRNSPGSISGQPRRAHADRRCGRRARGVATRIGPLYAGRRTTRRGRVADGDSIATIRRDPRIAGSPGPPEEVSTDAPLRGTTGDGRVGSGACQARRARPLAARTPPSPRPARRRRGPRWYCEDLRTAPPDRREADLLRHPRNLGERRRGNRGVGRLPRSTLSPCSRRLWVRSTGSSGCSR